MQLALTSIEWILWIVALAHALLPLVCYLLDKHDRRRDEKRGVKWRTPIVDSDFVNLFIFPVILMPALAITMYSGYSKLHFLWLVPLTRILFNYLNSQVRLAEDKFALRVLRAIFLIPQDYIGVLRGYWSRPKRTNWYCKGCHGKMKREYWVHGSVLLGAPSGYQHDNTCPHCGLISGSYSQGIRDDYERRGLL
jgi:hypothetical protein